MSGAWTRARSTSAETTVGGRRWGRSASRVPGPGGGQRRSRSSARSSSRPASASSAASRRDATRATSAALPPRRSAARQWRGARGAAGRARSPPGSRTGRATRARRARTADQARGRARRGPRARAPRGAGARRRCWSGRSRSTLRGSREKRGSAFEVVHDEGLPRDEREPCDPVLDGNREPDERLLPLTGDCLEHELVRAVVEQEDRGRLGAEDRPGDVDDRLEQLPVGRPRRRRAFPSRPRCACRCSSLTSCLPRSSPSDGGCSSAGTA